ERMHGDNCHQDAADIHKEGTKIIGLALRAKHTTLVHGGKPLLVEHLQETQRQHHQRTDQHVDHHTTRHAPVSDQVEHGKINNELVDPRLELKRHVGNQVGKIDVEHHRHAGQ